MKPFPPEKALSVRCAVIQWMDSRETQQQLASRIGASLGTIQRILLEERIKRREIRDNLRYARTLREAP